MEKNPIALPPQAFFRKVNSRTLRSFLDRTKSSQLEPNRLEQSLVLLTCETEPVPLDWSTIQN